MSSTPAKSARPFGRKRCPHGRSKYSCRECGVGYCDHGNNRYRCKECNVGFCEHKRDVYRCNECGTGLCIHDKQKRNCDVCGSGFCEHRQHKHQCRVCTPGKVPTEKSLSDTIFARELARCHHDKIRRECNFCSFSKWYDSFRSRKKRTQLAEDESWINFLSDEWR